MRINVITFFVLLFLMIPFFGNAESLYSQSLPETGGTNYSVFTFSFDNDALLKTDRYYTNGFLFSLLNKLPNPGLIYHKIFAGADLYNYYSLSLKQEIYTPENFSQDKISEGDRPFSANLILCYNEFYYSKSRKFIAKSFISAGIIGPSALGKEVQNGIHSLLPHSSDVPGWEFQIPDGVLLQTGMSFEKQIAAWKSLLINGEGDFSLGFPKTECGFGIHLVALSAKDYYYLPFYFNDAQNSFLFDFGVKIISKLYDANLQGLPWGKSAPYTIPNPTVFLLKISSGIKYRLNKWAFDINLYYLSPEFASGKRHLWNRFSVSYMF